MPNEVQKVAPKTGLAAFNAMLNAPKTADYLKTVLGKNAETFVTNLTAVVSSAPLLQDCERTSIMYAAINATSMGLSFNPNHGQCYIIPYNDTKNRIKVAQFQMGAKGYKQLAARSGQILRMNVTDVREGEIVSRDRLEGVTVFKWIEDDAEREKAKIVGYVGFIRTKWGYEKQLYMTVQQLEAHAKRYSKTYAHGYGVWKDNFEAMAKKTIYKLMLNGGDIPLSAEMQMANDYDQAVFRQPDKAEYVDAEEVATNPEQAGKAAEILAAALNVPEQGQTPAPTTDNKAGVTDVEPEGEGDDLPFDNE